MAGSRYDAPRRSASPLPPRFALTDPERTPDPLAFAAAQAPGDGLIYRHYGAEDREKIALKLADHLRKFGNILLISADPELALAVGAAGVHWPEKRLAQAARWRLRHPGLLFTASAHSGAALRKAAAAGADAALLSPVFPSASPSAGRPLGLWRAAALARQAKLPVYALGGVDRTKEKRLSALGFSGIAAVSGLQV
jgi:thiamine-phosphate pyrophosphorylase